MTSNSRGRCIIGKVYDGGSIPSTTDSFFLMHPVSISGAVLEGGSATLTTDTSRSFLCFVVGTVAPVVNEYYACRDTGNGYWTSDRVTYSSTPISIPGCPCVTTPSRINMLSSNHSVNNGTFQDATLVYGPKPPWANTIIAQPNIHMSLNSYIDGANGYTFYYTLTCVSGSYRLRRAYTNFGGSPLWEATARYTWSGGGSNTCTTPSWSFVTGTVYSGGGPVTVTLTG